MTQIRESIAIAADPDRVWALAGDVSAISTWVPAITESTAAGQERSCTTVDGGELQERIVERSDEERFYVYEITESPMPVSSYRSILSVQGHDGHSHVGWTADFEPADDAQAAELKETFTQIYRDGLESLRARIEGSNRAA